MAIVQDAYDIPADIVTGLLTGDYRRIGSVVRWATGPHKGQIVKHLAPVELPKTEQARGVVDQAIQFVQHHKKGVGIATIGAAAVGGGIGIYYYVKKHEPRVVKEFRAALKIYIDAIRQGNMDISVIDNLIVALETLKQHKNYEKISIQLTTEELDILVGRIYEYTVKLASDNHVELTEEDISQRNAGNAILSLHYCLKAQKRIFKEAA